VSNQKAIETLVQLHEDEESQLVSEYVDWCANNKLPYISADELILRDDLLNQEQINWLENFLDRWEAWEEKVLRYEPPEPPEDTPCLERPWWETER